MLAAKGNRRLLLWVAIKNDVMSLRSMRINIQVPSPRLLLPEASPCGSLNVGMAEHPLFLYSLSSSLGLSPPLWIEFGSPLGMSNL